MITTHLPPTAFSRRTEAAAPACASAAISDLSLARSVQTALRALARHSPHYAGVLASRSGARLAGHVARGEVDTLSNQGRDALLDIHHRLTRAQQIEPGLDTNEFMDQLLSRSNPRAQRAVQGAPAYLLR